MHLPKNLGVEERLVEQMQCRARDGMTRHGETVLDEESDPNGRVGGLKCNASTRIS